MSRSTLYRHFATRRDLVDALEAQVPLEPPPRLATLPYQPPGLLGRDRPLALEVTHVLDEVPPHLIADQLVAETRRAAGVPVALYVVDIDGSQLIRLAGSDDFPETLEAPPALGPEIVPEGLPGFYERLRETLPRSVPAPLWLRGRVLGLLITIGTPLAELEDIARQGAAALELANDYTDLIEAARRRAAHRALAPPTGGSQDSRRRPVRSSRTGRGAPVGALRPHAAGARRAWEPPSGGVTGCASAMSRPSCIPPGWSLRTSPARARRLRPVTRSSRSICAQCGHGRPS